MEFKIRLMLLGKKQVDLIEPLAEKGVFVAPCQLSIAINGKGKQKKHQKISQAVDEILTAWEGQEGK